MPRELYKPYSIKGQVALITGASSGIGEACAWRFAEAGCKLILLARRADRLDALEKELKKEYNVPIHCVVLDVQNIDAIATLPERLPQEFCEVDILVNNAGLALGTETCDTLDLKDSQIMIQSNITSVVAFIRAFTPSMRQRNSGHIINMSSVAGQEAYGGGSVYCGTKHAVEAITRSSRHDLIGTNIRVTAIAPGAVKTEFSLVRFNGDQSKADAVYEGIDPLTAADIADNVLYAATRPPHVQIAEITTMATLQSSAKGLARVLDNNKSNL